MSINIEVRKKQLENLDQLISVSKERLKQVYQNLGWSPDKVQTKENMVRCPVDTSHKLLKKNSGKHLEKCLIRNEGYDLKEEFLSYPPPDSKHTIVLSHEQKIGILSKAFQEKPNFRQETYCFNFKLEVILDPKSVPNFIECVAWNGIDPDPKTSNRLFSTFSSDERLAIYEYCIENTVAPPPPPEFTTIYDKKRDEDKQLSYEELLAQERDAKRRRTKYKSVHLNRKNYTEVIREVIENQMDEYKEWLNSKQKNIDQNNEDCSNNKNGTYDKDDPERPHSSISRNSTYSGSSRSTTRRHDDRRSRDRRRSSHRSPRRRTPDRYSSPDRYRNHGRSRSKNRKSRRSRSIERSHRYRHQSRY